MPKVLDKDSKTVIVKFTITEYNKFVNNWLSIKSKSRIYKKEDQNELFFDEAVKSKNIKSKLALLASKL